MRTHVLLISVAAMALMGCGGGGTRTIIGAPGDSRASVSVWNFLSVRAGGVPDLQTIINGQDCGKETPYLSATINENLKWFASTPNLPVRTAVTGGARLVAEDRAFLNAAAYTMAQVGVPGETADPLKPVMLYLQRDLAKVGATQIRVRFVHTAPSAAAVDLWLGRTGSEVKVASGVAYKGSPAAVTISLPTSAQGLTLIATPVGVAPKPATNVFNSGNLLSLVTGGNAYLVPLVHSGGVLSGKLNYLIGSDR